MTDDNQERRVTYGEFHHFETRMDGHIMDVKSAIKEARIEAREAHQRLREDWSGLLKDSIEHEGRLERVEGDIKLIIAARAADVKEAITASRFFWAQVVGVASLATGVFMWLVSLLKGSRP